MTADDYNHAELIAGRLTPHHITRLVAFFQDAHTTAQLKTDGKFGPLTRALLDEPVAAPAVPTQRWLRWPLPAIDGGRWPVITSGFRPADRPNHNGVDLFYEWRHGDRPEFIGDKGAAGKKPDGTPRWVVPYFASALAAAPGLVQMAGNSPTGYRVWIDHGNGWRTGYFHLETLRVRIGDRVEVGQSLGYVGDNPADNDGRHLHFELSPVDRYAPVDPEPHIAK